MKKLKKYYSSKYERLRNRRSQPAKVLSWRGRKEGLLEISRARSNEAFKKAIPNCNDVLSRLNRSIETSLLIQLQ